MPATVDLTEADILSALGTFLVTILGSDVPVLTGQVNRVAQPAALDFVVMTPMSRVRLATNVDSYRDGFYATPRPLKGAVAVLQSTEITIQIDVHGPTSANNAQIISTLFRDDYACETFAAANPAIAPLYADDPKQMNFNNGENQYEDRWTIDAVLQVNITVTIGRDFAGTIDVGIINVDARFPP